jgi:hypothetical protein
MSELGIAASGDDGQTHDSEYGGEVADRTVEAAGAVRHEQPG